MVGSTTVSPSATRSSASTRMAGILDAVLEQVGHPLGMGVDEPHGVAGFDVVGQHHHPGPGQLLLDSGGRDQALVGVRRGHPDIHDDDVRPQLAGQYQQLVPVGRLTDDLDVGRLQHPGKPLPDEHHVVRDQDPHGNSARIIGRRRLPVRTPPGDRRPHRCDRRCG